MLALRQDAPYQFVGRAAHPPASIVIATALAINPQAGWALLFSGRWVTLGQPAQGSASLDTDDVSRRAEAWLRCQLRQA